MALYGEGRAGPEPVARSGFLNLATEALYGRLVNGHAIAYLDNIVSQPINRIGVAIQALFNGVKSLVKVAYQVVETGIHGIKARNHCLEAGVRLVTCSPEPGVRLLTCSLEPGVNQIKTGTHLFNCSLEASVNQIKTNFNDIKASVHAHKVAYTRYDNCEHRYNGGYTPSIPVQPFPHDPIPLSTLSGGIPPCLADRRRLCCSGAL